MVRILVPTQFSNKYCELKEKIGTKRRTCKITEDQTKNSDSCEYRKENDKCYVLNKKKSPPKTVLTSSEFILHYKFQENPSLETIRKYRKHIHQLNSTTDLEYLYDNLDSKPEKTGDFWMNNSIIHNTKTLETPEPLIKPILSKKTPVQNTVKPTKELPPFNNNDYELINVAADGNCGYHSFIKAMKLRKYSLVYYKIERDTPDKLRILLDKKLSNSKDPNNIIVRKRIKGGINKTNISEEFWLEQEEFQLLASIFKVCIHVWDSRINLWSYIPINHKENFDTCINKQQNIYIYADGNHYQILKNRI
jgi:hypothetical protein|tara:strand:+ start:15297 stop:16217 length:921 start_codon:yes stop_codon:yes gene_type:complete